MKIVYTGPERPGRYLDDGRLAEHGTPIEVDAETARGLLSTAVWDADTATATDVSRSVDEVLADVGDDQQKAIGALQAEHARPGGPRKTLIEQLSRIIDAADSGEEE